MICADCGRMVVNLINGKCPHCGGNVREPMPKEYRAGEK